MRTTERIAIGRRSSEVGGLRLRTPVRAKRNRQARQTRDALYEYCRARLPSLRERASACAMRHGVRAWSLALSGARAPAACATGDDGLDGFTLRHETTSSRACKGSWFIYIY